ncbi:MAG TPA: hypothetical protein VKE70_11860 [Candidatus Solibacter sp.]|nr:hypothetical protein [Candidatus Solibacter sp.]
MFNAATIVDHATYEKPHQYATGVEYVIVNGRLVLDRGQHTGARPGAILYDQGNDRFPTAASVFQAHSRMVVVSAFRRVIHSPQQQWMPAF